MIAAVSITALPFHHLESEPSTLSLAHEPKILVLAPAPDLTNDSATFISRILTFIFSKPPVFTEPEKPVRFDEESPSLPFPVSNEIELTVEPLTPEPELTIRPITPEIESTVESETAEPELTVEVTPFIPVSDVLEFSAEQEVDVTELPIDPITEVPESSAELPTPESDDVEADLVTSEPETTAHPAVQEDQETSIEHQNLESDVQVELFFLLPDLSKETESSETTESPTELAETLAEEVEMLLSIVTPSSVFIAPDFEGSGESESPVELINAEQEILADAVTHPQDLPADSVISGPDSSVEEQTLELETPDNQVQSIFQVDSLNEVETSELELEAEEGPIESHLPAESETPSSTHLPFLIQFLTVDK